ncbi:hypothetical protein LJR235_000220 [Pararhizobium sp. LjRoot235]
MRVALREGCRNRETQYNIGEYSWRCMEKDRLQPLQNVHEARTIQHRFENPDAISNFIRMVTVFALGADLTSVLGRMVENSAC